jgi:hypothetical protein
MDLLFIHGKQRMKYLFLSIGCGHLLTFLSSSPLIENNLQHAVAGTECNLAACMVAVIDTIPDRLPTNGYIHHRLCVCLPGDYPTRSLEFLQIGE